MRTTIDGWVIDHDNGVAERGGESLMYFDGKVIVTHYVMDAYGCGCEVDMRVPLDVVAEFLRACGYVVVNPVLAGKTESPPEGAEERCVEMLNANATVERVR